MFGGGNPISRIETNGHINAAEGGGAGGVAPRPVVEPVVEKVGSRYVAAPDQGTYQQAYDTVKSKLIGDEGGQGQEYMVGCNSTETWVVQAGKRSTCGVSDVWFSRLFADELCRQPGIECSGYDPSGTSAGGFSDGSSLGAGVGPEQKGLGIRNPGGGACEVNSFTGDTLFLMADGTKKPIRDVKLGDEVVAADPETGKPLPRKVVDLIRHRGWHTMVAVRLADGTAIDATDHHPFWDASRGTWVDAIDLEPGSVVIDANDDRLTVASLVVSEQDLTAYNLIVAHLHTYHAGDDSILVHNATCWSIGSRLKAAGPGSEMGLPSSGKIRFVPVRGYDRLRTRCLADHKGAMSTGSATSGSLARRGPRDTRSSGTFSCLEPDRLNSGGCPVTAPTLTCHRSERSPTDGSAAVLCAGTHPGAWYSRRSEQTACGRRRARQK